MIFLKFKVEEYTVSQNRNKLKNDLDINKIYRNNLIQYKDSDEALLETFKTVEEVVIKHLNDEELEVYYLLLESDYNPTDDEKEIPENFSLYNKRAYKIANRVIREISKSPHITKLREIRKRLLNLD